MNLIGCGQADGWKDEGWSIPATNAQFRDGYADFAPHLLDLISAVPDERFSSGACMTESRWSDYDPAAVPIGVR